MDLHEHKHLLFILFSFRLYRNIYNKYIEPETNEGKKKKEEELYKQYKKNKNNKIRAESVPNAEAIHGDRIDRS